MKYLTINEEDEKWDSFITTVGFQIIKPFASFPGHSGAVDHQIPKTINRHFRNTLTTSTF